MRSKYEAFEAHFNALPKEKQHVIRQYQAVAGPLVELFNEIYLRTDHSLWKSDGVGTCDVDKSFSEEGIANTISNDFIRLRGFRSNEFQGYNNQAACSYHRPKIGCVLGDLRGPKCLNSIEPQLHKEIEERFGISLLNHDKAINGKKTLSITDILKRITSGGKGEDGKLHPEVNDELVKAYTEGIRAVINHVKTFPILEMVRPKARELELVNYAFGRNFDKIRYKLG